MKSVYMDLHILLKNLTFIFHPVNPHVTHLGPRFANQIAQSATLATNSNPHVTHMFRNVNSSVTIRHTTQLLFIILDIWDEMQHESTICHLTLSTLSINFIQSCITSGMNIYVTRMLHQSVSILQCVMT